MDFQCRSIEPADKQIVSQLLIEHWGTEVVVSRGKAWRPAELPGMLAETQGQIVGLITWRVDNLSTEIVTLNSFSEGRGVGAALLKEAENVARKAGQTDLWLVSTNDNVRAIGFYQKCGWEMAAFHRNALDISRRVKPEIPLRGYNDIPIVHEIEFRLAL